MIYLDNAATTLQKPDCVIEAVCRAMQTVGNSGRSGHGYALDASRVVYGTREKLAKLFHCRADHVCFTANSTEALNTAILGLLSPEDHVISTDLEHNSVLRPLYRLRDAGMGLDFVPADRGGQIDYDDFPRLLRKNTKAVVCTHGSNLTGDLLDPKRIGTFCRENGLLFIVDASQTAGVFPIDMEKMHIDVLCFTGHKSLCGPQGTGGLCVREGIGIRPLKEGGTGVQTHLTRQPEQYPTRLEAGTLNVHGIAGLSAALDELARAGMDAIREREAALCRRLYDGVRDVPGVTVYGDFSADDRAPIVTLNIKDEDSGRIADLLAEEYGIAVRGGAHCAPRLHAALGTTGQGAVRFSLGRYTTVADVDAAIAAVKELAE